MVDVSMGEHYLIHIELMLTGKLGDDIEGTITWIDDYRRGVAGRLASEPSAPSSVVAS